LIGKDIRFGDYLKQLIREAGYTQNEFYTQLGIKKPYFYDIISGRTNPPPPHLQFKALEILHADDETKELFFNLAAKERGELPADIIQMVAENPDAITAIRSNLRKSRKDGREL
jgi:transcriptional regulator with XRE-family HTH domain